MNENNGISWYYVGPPAPESPEPQTEAELLDAIKKARQQVAAGKATIREVREMCRRIANAEAAVDPVTWAIALLAKFGRNKARIAREIGVPRTSMTGKKWASFNLAYNKLK